MLKHLPAISKTFKGMGVLMENERPVIRFMAQHWPLTMLTGYALYHRLNKRRKAKTLSAFTALTDTGMIMGPLAAVALISMASKKSPVIAPEPLNQQKALPAPSPEVHGFAGAPPPSFFATRPPHEANAATPAPAEEIVTKAGPPPSAANTLSGGPYNSFLD